MSVDQESLRPELGLSQGFGLPLCLALDPEVQLSWWMWEAKRLPVQEPFLPWPRPRGAESSLNRESRQPQLAHCDLCQTMYVWV